MNNGTKTEAASGETSAEILTDREMFATALKPLGTLPADSYFIYGSTALDVREGRSVFGGEKVRFRGRDGMRDIDVGVFENTIDWNTIRDVAQGILDNTGGIYCMDPHLVRCNGELAEIKGAVFPRCWLSTEAVFMDGVELSVIEPIPALMIRLLHGDPRVRDTKRIIREIELLPNISALNDERIIYGLKEDLHLGDNPSRQNPEYL